MSSGKFQGWRQLTIVAVGSGFASIFASTCIQYSNTIMRANEQVAMSATAFGIAASFLAFMQGLPQPIIGRVVRKAGSRKVLLVGTVCGIVNILTACALSVMPTIYGNYFGREYFASIQGISLLAGGLLSSTTGVIGGVIADTTGSYDAAFYLYAIIALVGAAIFIFAVGTPSARKYKKELAVSGR